MIAIEPLARITKRPAWSALGSALCVVALLGASTPASAQESPEEAEGSAEAINDEARSLYEAGAAAFGDGRFQAALTYWQNSYELSGRVELLHNIGIAHDRLGQGAEAVENYRAFLAERPEADNRAYVERRISQLEERAVAQEDAGADEDSSRLNVGAIALTSVGGAMLISGLGTALATNGRFSDLEAACPDMVCDDSERGNAAKVQRLARATDVLLIVGAAAALTGVIWWIVGGGDDEPDVQVGVGPTGFDVRGRF